MGEMKKVVELACHVCARPVKGEFWWDEDCMDALKAVCPECSKDSNNLSVQMDIE